MKTRLIGMCFALVLVAAWVAPIASAGGWGRP